MPRRNYNEDEVEESTFTGDYRSVLKEKHMTAGAVRLAAHNKTRVAYFHDEGAGNYHYGVNKNKMFKHVMLFTPSRFIFLGKTPYETSSFNFNQSLGVKLWIAQ